MAKGSRHTRSAPTSGRSPSLSDLGIKTISEGRVRIAKCDLLTLYGSNHLLRQMRKARALPARSPNDRKDEVCP